jgi:hypothetical protein
MNSETREEIMNLIKEVSLYRYDLQDIDKSHENIKTTRSIENALYGLFDGYLYDSLQLNALKCPTNLATKIVRIYHMCSMYPKSETKIF